MQGVVVFNSIVLIVLVKDQDDGRFLEEVDIFMLEKEERKDSEVEERHGRVKSRRCQQCIWGATGWREIRFRVSSASAFEIYLTNQGTLPQGPIA